MSHAQLEIWRKIQRKQAEADELVEYPNNPQNNPYPSQRSRAGRLNSRAAKLEEIKEGSAHNATGDDGHDTSNELQPEDNFLNNDMVNMPGTDLQLME